jgi:hypothetical protein
VRRFKAARKPLFTRAPYSYLDVMPVDTLSFGSVSSDRRLPYKIPGANILLNLLNASSASAGQA